MEGELKAWWVVRGFDRNGPYTRTELAELAATGKLVATDRLWKEGLKANVQASSLGLNFPESVSVPETPMEQPSPPPPASGDFNPYHAPRAEVTPLTSGASGNGFMQQARKVPAGHGLQWIGEAKDILLQAPFLLLGAAIIVSVLGAIVRAIPIVGWILGGLTMPFSVVAPMTLNHKISRGEKVGIGNLFDCFSNEPMRLVFLGMAEAALFACVGIIALIILFLVMGTTLPLGEISSGHYEQFLQYVRAIGGLRIFLAVIAILALTVSAGSAIYFAPPLAYFTEIGLLAAFRSSFRATWTNWAPMLVNLLFSLIAFSLLIGGGIVGISFFHETLVRVALGIALAFAGLMTFPFLLAMHYCMFRDFYRQQ